MMKKVNLNIRISEELRKRFKEVANQNAHNPSELMRKWIKEYIEENKGDDAEADNTPETAEDTI